MVVHEEKDEMTCISWSILTCRGKRDRKGVDSYHTFPPRARLASEPRPSSVRQLSLFTITYVYISFPSFLHIFGDM